MRRIAVLVAALATLIPAPAQARPGDLDRTFAEKGRKGYALYGEGASVRGMVLAGGVRPLLSVAAARAGTSAPTWLRLTARGRVASRTRIASPYAPPLASGFALLEGTWGQRPRQYRVAKAGGAPTITLTMPSPGFVLESFAVDRSGRVLVAGEDLEAGPARTVTVLRFLPSGQLDPSYGTGGSAPLASVRFGKLLLLRDDGRTYVSDGDRLAALDPDGRPLPGFQQGRVITPGGRAFTPGAAALAEGPGGTLLAAGTDEDDSGWLVRVRGDGSADPRFARGGLLRGPALERVRPSALTRDRRGRLVLAGARWRGGSFEAAVVRLSARGRPDRSFGTRGRKVLRLGSVRGVRIVSSAADHVAVDRRGRIVIAGAVYDDEFEGREDQGQPYPAIARLQG